MRQSHRPRRPQGAAGSHRVTNGPGRWWLVSRRKRAPSSMDAVSGATERPCPHRSRVVTHGYEDIYSRSTPDAKIFQSGISPKVAKNPRKKNPVKPQRTTGSLDITFRGEWCWQNNTPQPLATTEIHANHLEAFHTSLRRRCAAYRRHTNMYAKNTARLQERLDVYWIMHNFVRVHFTTRQVPAVALKVLEHGLSLNEIFFIQKIA